MYTNEELEFKWELIADYTRRAKVMGGWIVDVINEQKYASDHNNIPISNSVVFIPDIYHKWVVKGR